MTLWQKIETAALLALLSSCGAVACAAAPYAPTQTQLICYAQADAAATERVNDECGGHLTSCPAKDDIVAKLQAALEVCK